MNWHSGRVLLLLLLCLALPAAALLRSAPRMRVPLAAPADSLVALLDQSEPGPSGVSVQQLASLSQTIRGRLVKQLGRRGYRIMAEENTVAILRDMGVDLTQCDGDCALQVARDLQVDWLFTTRIVAFAGLWTAQIHLLRTATGAMVDSEEGECQRVGELPRLLRELTDRLCQSQFPQPGSELPPESTSMEEEVPDPRSDPLRTSPHDDANPVDSDPVGQRMPLRKQGWETESRRLGIRNRFCLEAGYGQGFFYPMGQRAAGREPITWGGELRLPDPERRNVDLLLGWWRATALPEGSFHSGMPALLRGVVEMTPLHLGPLCGILRAGYQAVRLPSTWDERRWLGGALLEYRTGFGLTLAGGMDMQRNHAAGDGSLGPSDKILRTEAVWSGESLGLALEGLFDAADVADPVFSVRLRFY